MTLPIPDVPSQRTPFMGQEHQQHLGLVLWFTGLSGAGKSTIAQALESNLQTQGLRTFILDGDIIRQGLCRDLGFSDADRIENNRRLMEVARLMMEAGIIVITAIISPFSEERQKARNRIGTDRFLEVFIDTPLSICQERDPKGLYQRKVPLMTGIRSLYQPPTEPDIHLKTIESSVSQSVDSIITYLKTHHLIPSLSLP